MGPLALLIARGFPQGSPSGRRSCGVGGAMPPTGLTHWGAYAVWPTAQACGSPQRYSSPAWGWTCFRGARAGRTLPPVAVMATGSPEASDIGLRDQFEQPYARRGGNPDVHSYGGLVPSLHISTGKIWLLLPDLYGFYSASNPNNQRYLDRCTTLLVCSYTRHQQLATTHAQYPLPLVGDWAMTQSNGHIFEL